MTNGNSILVKKCDLCNVTLKEAERDIHELNKAYEFPYQIKWDGTDCQITNKVVRHVCENCLNKVMVLMNSLMGEAQGE